jgi:hypothetical protein
MKVEAGESLILSWLRHVVGCQIVQLNWKPSVDRWKLHDGEMLRPRCVSPSPSGAALRLPRHVGQRENN